MKATIARLENKNKALREVNASLTKRVDQLTEWLTSVEVLMIEEEIDDAEEEVYNAQVIAQDIAQHIDLDQIVIVILIVIANLNILMFLKTLYTNISSIYCSFRRTLMVFTPKMLILLYLR